MTFSSRSKNNSQCVNPGFKLGLNPGFTQDCENPGFTQDCENPGFTQCVNPGFTQKISV